MVRRQTRDIPEASAEEALVMIVDRRSMQRIEDDLKIVEEEMELVGQQRSDQKNKRHSKAKQRNHLKKQVRFKSPSSDDPASRSLRHIPDDTIIDLGGATHLTKPKYGTEEYRRSQKAAFEKSDAEKRARLMESLRRLENLTAQTSTYDAPKGNLASQITTTAEQDTQSEESEESDYEEYLGISSVSAQPASKATPRADELSLREINRLENERQTLEVPVQLQPVQPEVPRAPDSKQAPDPELAQEILRRRAGIGTIQPLGREDEVNADAVLVTPDSPDGFPEYVWQYYVFGAYEGIEGIAMDEHGAHGIFLHEQNARNRVGEAVVKFSNAYRVAHEAAVAAEDETRIAQLGDLEDCRIRWNKKTGEQVVEFPAASCRVWIETKRIRAKTKAEKKVSAPAKFYVARYRRTMPDGSVRTSSLDDAVPCTCPLLANEKACEIMGDWYGEHMKDGYLDMQKDAFDLEVDRLGEEGRWDMEETLNVPGGEERMEVWVEERKVKGPRN